MTVSLIDRNSGEAVYRQISRILEQEIRGHYEAGDCLPAEYELAQRFAVNRHTLRRAIDELVDLGLLERRHGRGTFVLAPAVDYAIGRGTRFTESLESRGKTTDTSILRKLILPARDGVAKRLAVPGGEPVIMVETLRQVDGVPFCVISHFMPESGFSVVHERYSGGSLHAFLGDNLGLRLRRTESLITACLPQGDDAHHLNMPQYLPVLRVKSVNVDELTGKPVEYALTRFRSDRIQLLVTP